MKVTSDTSGLNEMGWGCKNQPELEKAIIKAGRFFRNKFEDINKKK